MLERRHIEAIEQAADDLEAVCDDCQCGRASVLGRSGLDSAISAALVAAGESPWRSMGSAPKDGTWVEVGRYINGQWEYCKSGYFHDAGSPIEGEPPSPFWSEEYDTCGVTDDGGLWLTHWRPRDVGPYMIYDICDPESI